MADPCQAQPVPRAVNRGRGTKVRSADLEEDAEVLVHRRPSGKAPMP
jgi:hypothetical protein